MGWEDGACGHCRSHRHHFPRGPWVGSEAQNVSADICAARPVSHCCSCLPSTASTPSYRDIGVLCARTQHPFTPTLFFLGFSPPSSIIHVCSVELYLCTHMQYILHGMSANTHSDTHFYSLHLTVFLLLLLHTFALCLCQFHLSRSIMQVLTALFFLTAGGRIFFPSKVFFS